MITVQVIQRIIEAPLVIADLTESNANVFYELAIRHATGKPFVQIIGKGTKIPFDVAGLRTIEVDVRDLKSVERAKVQLRDQIHALRTATGALDTPISLAVDLTALRASQNPAARGMADMHLMLTDLKNELSSVSTRFAASELVTQAAAEEVRAVANRMFARISGVPDPGVLSAINDANQLVLRARQSCGREGQRLLDKAEALLRQVALRLMGTGGDIQSAGARRPKTQRPRRR